MKCNCDPHIEYCDICFPPEKRQAIVKPRNGKPLTDEEVLEIGRKLGMQCVLGNYRNIDFDYARAIERAHGIGVEP